MILNDNSQSLKIYLVIQKHNTVIHPKLMRPVQFASITIQRAN
jgi:hypothetical protein